MTGYQSKKAAAQDKLVVTDIDGHVVRDVRNPKKAVLYEFVACSSNNYPPQRPWVGLTEDELVQIGVATGLERAAVEMISNKLKEKNT